MAQKLNSERNQKFIRLYVNGYREEKMTEELDISRRKYFRIWKQLLETEKIVSKPRSGRPPKGTEREVSMY